MPAVGLSDVIDAADVGVCYLACDAHLASETLQSGWIGLKIGGEKLERHRLTQLEVVRAIDVTHPTLSDLKGEAVAPGQRLTGRERCALPDSKRRGIRLRLGHGGGELFERCTAGGAATALLRYFFGAGWAGRHVRSGW